MRSEELDACGGDCETLDEYVSMMIEKKMRKACRVVTEKCRACERFEKCDGCGECGDCEE